MNPTTVAQAAAQYIAKGWSVVPVPARSKGPTAKGWNDPERLFSPSDFGEGANIGLRLGIISGHLTDFDLDAPEVLAAAPVFLPNMEMISGHASKPESHRWFITTEPIITVQFKDPLLKQTDPPKATLLEVRANAKTGRCHQTVVPPSIHQSGEPIGWVNGLNKCVRIEFNETSEVEATLRWFDRYSLCVEVNGVAVLVWKHAIRTTAPAAKEAQ
jgi:hypothetical protein